MKKRSEVRPADATPVWLQNMNPEQVQAIMHQDGPCALLAQAGCHRRGQLVVKHDGSLVRVEDVRVGDRLQGLGGPRTVLSLCMGRGRMYIVRPVKGEPWVVNEDHILTVVETSTDVWEDISVREVVAKSGWWKANHKLVRAGQVEFECREGMFVLNPYLIGLFLGDGCITKSAEVCTADPEIADYLHEVAQWHGLKMVVRPAGGISSSYVFTAGNGPGLGPDRNPIVTTLRELGIYGCDSGTKFIPRQYLVASVEDRLELLAGLVDTDGSVANGYVDYITKSPQLAEDILFLARSLGFAAYSKPCEKRDQHGNGGTYYRVGISGAVAEIPCRVPRKQAGERRQKKDVRRTGFTLEPLPEEEEFFGFSLDGDQRYLLGDFTVTHNSGKTRALVHRIARMVEQGVSPKSVLAVTFSKKAAEEMNTRLVQLGIRDARVGTWHSLCLQIIKDDETPWRDWNVDDTSRDKLVLKKVLGYEVLDWKDADVGVVGRFLTTCKANLVKHTDEERALEIARQFLPSSREQQLLVDAYQAYQNRIEELGMLVFDDFLMFAHRWLTESEENRARWAGKWQYLLIDEAQDNNLAQKELQYLLAKDHCNIMVVGDVAQAIYSFRGSKPDYLANFAQEWDGSVGSGKRSATVIMNRNYRSGRAIVDAANRIIAPATIRLPTDMVAERDADGTVRVAAHTNQDDEGEAFAQWVLELSSGGQALSSITALFRTNAQSRALEEACLSHRIPYLVVGGTSFYQRKEVRGLLGYLYVAAGRDPEGEWVAQCINAPFRYLGRAFVDRMQDAARGKRVNDWAALAGTVAAQAGIQSRQRQSVGEWAGHLERARKAIAEDKSPGEILENLVHATRYIEWITRDEGEESVETSHQANVREMVRIASRFATVKELLDYIDDVQRAAKRQRGDRQAGGDRVLLMSIHRSKGLEWPNVWVNGCNDLVLPHARGDVEEERRLMYVAATRARDNLVLSYVRQFARPEGIREATPSVFLREAGLA